VLKKQQTNNKQAASPCWRGSVTRDKQNEKKHRSKISASEGIIRQKK
jgi:hypothetical protein